MSLRKTLFGAALAAPLALAGCGEDATFQLQLLHADCRGQKEALSGNEELIIRVTGDGMSAIEVKARASAGSVDLPEVPFGSNRIVSVEAFTNQGLDLVAYGESAPFEVKKDSTPPVTVVVQRVNEFTQSANSSNECTTMSTSRAGHTAVLLQDGRVLLAGGYSSIDTVGRGSGFRVSAEIYDPISGTFTEVAKPCDGEVCLEAGHATGTLLPDGRVLIAGGQVEGGGSSNVAMVYDPAADSWKHVEMLAARHGHTAHLMGGKVLLVGGRDPTGEGTPVLKSTEFFDPRQNRFFTGPEIPAVDGVSDPGRAFHVGATINSTNAVIAGGIDGADGPVASMVFFSTDRSGANFEAHRGPMQLADPTLLSAGGLVNGRLIVAGGTGGFAGASVDARPVAGSATKVSEWFEPSLAASTQGEFELNEARYGACSVQMDDDRLLILGGVASNGSPTDTAEVISWNGNTGAPERNYIGKGRTAGESRMTTKREWATCTRLDDGRILVAGGNTVSGVTPSAETMIIPRLPSANGR